MITLKKFSALAIAASFFIGAADAAKKEVKPARPQAQAAQKAKPQEKKKDAAANMQIFQNHLQAVQGKPNHPKAQNQTALQLLQTAIQNNLQKQKKEKRAKAAPAAVNSKRKGDIQKWLAKRDEMMKKGLIKRK